MPAHAPAYMTDERERELYRAMSRLFEDYCGDDPSLYPARQASFINVMDAIDNELAVKSSGD